MKKKRKIPDGIPCGPGYTGLYAGFEPKEKMCVWLGGRYYNDNAQIHLDKEEVLKLRLWINRVYKFWKDYK